MGLLVICQVCGIGISDVVMSGLGSHRMLRATGMRENLAFDLLIQFVERLLVMLPSSPAVLHQPIHSYEKRKEEIAFYWVYTAFRTLLLVTSYIFHCHTGKETEVQS